MNADVYRKRKECSCSWIQLKIITINITTRKCFCAFTREQFCETTEKLVSFLAFRNSGTKIFLVSMK